MPGNNGNGNGPPFPPPGQAPVALDDQLFADEDTFNFADLFLDNGSGADLDPNGDLFTLTEIDGNAASVGVPVLVISSGGRQGELTVFSDGTLNFNPMSNFNNLAQGETDTITFSYEITDSHGFSSAVPAFVTITIVGTNDAPVAQNLTIAAVEDGVAVTASFDADDVDSDDGPATLSFVIQTEPSEGTVVNNGDGTFQFSPGLDFQDLSEGEERSVTFSYAAVDQHGTLSEPKDVTVIVTGTNDPPVVQGTEFQINTETLDNQFDSSVAALADGGFVVTWTSRDSNEQGVYGQRFDNGGNAVLFDYNGDGTLESEFQINTETFDNQLDSSVAALADGGFVVTWSSLDQDGSEQGVYGRRFDNDGNAVLFDYNGDGTLESEFQINTETLDNQFDSSVAALADGGFVVTWTSRDSNEQGVYGRRFDNGGNAVLFDYNGDGTLESEFQINTETFDNQLDSSVAALADGGFVVTWSSLDQDGSEQGVYGRRFDSDGNAVLFDYNGDGTLESEFQINTETLDNQFDSSVAALADGGFVVTWTSRDSNEQGVYGQRFDNGGNAVLFDYNGDGTLESEFQINTETFDNQLDSSVAALADGGFVVTWSSLDQDGSEQGVYGRRFDNDGNAVLIDYNGDGTLESEFQINTETFDNQLDSSVAALADGGFVVTWSSLDQDGSEQGIYGRRFNFQDEFGGLGIGEQATMDIEYLMSDDSGDESLSALYLTNNGVDDFII